MKKLLIIMILTLFIVSCSVSNVEETSLDDSGMDEPNDGGAAEVTEDQPPEIPDDSTETAEVVEEADDDLSPDESLEVEQLDEDLDLLEDDEIDMDLSSIEDW